MNRRLLSGILLIFSLSVTPAHAITDPLAVPNNKFGIHILDESDIGTAAQLVNSQGGDWGYITMVMNLSDRDHSHWQRVFDQLRIHHLIPIIRLATTSTGEFWTKPLDSDAHNWAQFLNSLNWVVKNRYVILFNEPNHAKEWGGEIKPYDYTQIAIKYASALKQASPDFFILPAALDTAAPNGPDTMSSTEFLRQMYISDNQVFTSFDGWNAHAYPNPGFVAKVTDKGPMGIQSFTYSKRQAVAYGLNPDALVFITETGWLHLSSQNDTNIGLAPDTIATNYKYAFEHIWSSADIVAVTPFILRYQAPPFEGFSWKKTDSDEYYPQFDTVKSLSKSTGSPIQIHRGSLNRLPFPDELITNRTYQITTLLTNTGQSIWRPEDITINSLTPPGIEVNISPLTKAIEPHHPTPITVTITTSNELGDFDINMFISKGQDSISPHYHQPLTVKPPNLLTSLKIWIHQNLTQPNLRVM